MEARLKHANIMSEFHRLLKFLSLGAWIALSSAPSLSGADNSGRRLVPAPMPPAAARTRVLAALPATQRLQLSLALPVRDPAALQARLKELYDPASPNYHHYLTPQQFADAFGPSPADYQALLDFAAQHGLQVVATRTSRLGLEVSGAVRDVEKTFQVKLHRYQHPTELRTFFAPERQPSVESGLPVRLLRVSGLDDYAQPRPASLLSHAVRLEAGTSPVATPDAGSGPGGTYVGRDFRTAYVPGTKLAGTGQSVALLEFDGYHASDISAYETANKLPSVPLHNVAVNGGVPTPGSGEEEVALDIEMAISMATNLAQVLVYEAPPGTAWTQILGRMADDNLAAQISCSWYQNGGGPDPASEQIFQQMAAQGQSFFAASGDNDAYVPGVADIPFPDDSPNITIVGGTTLTTATRGATWASETAWNTGLDTTSGQYVGTGGGVSSSYPIPYWQLGIDSFLSNGGSTVARNIPDVALTADNIYVYFGSGQKGVVGGTSCATPLWAGLLALVNQQSVASNNAVVGFINPAVYEIANESTYSAAFHDIQTGNNAWASSPNLFNAVPGYDLCTGLGTPKGAALINALVSPDPLVIISNGGFTASGTPAGTFNISTQTYALTNTGLAPLNWSLNNTSTWLSASPSSGTLPAGGSDAVTVSLNTVASGLPAGTYTASLCFSNVTTKVGHSRFFTLTTVDPLVVLPPTALFFSGPPGGPFVGAAPGITLTNPTACPLSFRCGATAAWLTPSPAAGALAPGSQTTISFAPTLAAINLNDGYYPCVFQITNLVTQVAQKVSVLLNVGLVENGGFETGDFTGWTLVGNTDGNGSVYDAVVGTNSLADGSGPLFIHSGNYGGFLGDTNVATLSQVLSTTPGQNYQVSFWVDNPGSGTPQQFFASWNTNAASNNPIYTLNNPPVMAWTQLTFTVQATETQTTLQFGALNPPDGFGLDDISVVALAPPVFISQPVDQTALIGSPATLGGAVRGLGPFTYQWCLNGTNLPVGGNAFGIATPTLTIAPAGLANIGAYTLVVTNAYGAVTSSVANLTLANNALIHPDGTVGLNLLGTAGGTFVLWAATHLDPPADWQPVATNTLDSTGIWQFTDAAATNNPQRFYQLLSAP